MLLQKTKEIKKCYVLQNLFTEKIKKKNNY